ncbi:MAG TPA: M20 family metallopeptidase [Desulfobacterales bacterium]
MDSVVRLTQKLIAYDTVNPPGEEQACARFLASLLEDGGFQVDAYEFADRRTSLVARKMFNADVPPICFTGHLDTVPLGTVHWQGDPFGGALENGRLYGRGASDMKGGVAAMVTAALRAAACAGGSSGIVLVLTAGEENGCQGARFLAGLEGVLGEAGALVVGEPTANLPLIGHKGALWLEGSTYGISAHGSMPEEGENAIYAAARAVLALEKFRFGVPDHPILGKPTVNLGTISGGVNINSVPDRARFEIDIRTVPPLTANQVLLELRHALGAAVELNIINDAPAVASNPEDRWVRQVFDIAAAHHRRRLPVRGATYFTDASALTDAMGHPPVILLGPGEPTQAHKTDEFVYADKIEAAEEMYVEIIRRWCDR